jgi:hypothetical protein
VEKDGFSAVLAVRISLMLEEDVLGRNFDENRFDYDQRWDRVGTDFGKGNVRFFWGKLGTWRTLQAQSAIGA